MLQTKVDDSSMKIHDKPSFSACEFFESQDERRSFGLHFSKTPFFLPRPIELSDSVFVDKTRPHTRKTGVCFPAEFDFEGRVADHCRTTNNLSLICFNRFQSVSLNVRHVTR